MAKSQLRLGVAVRPIHALILGFLALCLSACVTAGTEIHAGRNDLLYGDPNLAVVRFQRAAEMNPNNLHFSALPQGAWTYVGRAYYAGGKLPEARQALERAVARSDQDSLAKLYLGLVLARDGDRARAVNEIRLGLEGIHGWLDYVEFNFAFSFGRFWDPRKEIRTEINSDLAMISRGIDWPKLISSGEWVGRQIEEEIDRARKDEREDRSRESDNTKP